MPEYRYKAVSKNGPIEEGGIQAANRESVLIQLRAKGLTPLKISEKDEQNDTQAPSKVFVRHRSRRVSKAPVGRSDVIALTSELAVLMRAGLPIDRALKILLEMSAKQRYTELLQYLLDTVKGGKPLSTALQQHERLFGSFYINMVRAGEASGQVSQVLARLAEHLEQSKQVRGTVVSALIYPAILALVAVLSVVVMLGFVVPQFETLFADMGDALPGMTRAVIVTGEWVQNWWWLVLMVVVPGFWFLRRWVGQPGGKRWLDRLLLRLPFAGGVLFKYEVARFARTLGTLQGSGVSLLQSLNIAVNTVGNVHIRHLFEVLAPAVKSGRRMSAVLQENGGFSPMVVQMVRVGEESGQLGEMMLELAKVYDAEVQAGVKRGLTLLEPVLILFMGGGIALIIISILMGILSVNDLAM